MENNSRGRNNIEAPKAESDKPDSETKVSKKKSRSTESESLGDKKPRASRELGQSVFSAERAAEASESPLFVAFKKGEITEKPATNQAKEIDDSVETAEDIEVAATVEQEKQHVASEIARSHLEQLENVDAEAADKKFLEQVADGEDLETAFAQIATEYGLSEDEIAEALAEMPPEETLEANLETVDPEFSDDDAAAETTPAELDDEAEIDLNPTSSGPRPTSSGSGSGSSGGSTPPVTPTPSASGPAPVPVPRPSQVLAPLPSAANQAPAAPVERYDANRAKAGQLLLVGIVGYLYGKHRGRLKTEKRLLPVQRKLQKQVVQLERDISHKEQLLVAAKTRAEQPRPAAKSEVPTARQETPVYAPAERTQPGLKETRIGMEKPIPAERLGHMVVAAEAPHTASQQSKAEKPNNIRQAFRAEQVKDMRRGELLEISEKIIVEGASLRKIYESNLVGEKQLRHLVSEYLQGKDIRKELRREMVEHEIDFERDPIMRDRVRNHLAGGGKSGLSEMLASAGISTQDDDSESARRARSDEQHEAKVKQRQERRQRVAADSALATAVVVLAIAVLILALRS